MKHSRNRYIRKMRRFFRNIRLRYQSWRFERWLKSNLPEYRRLYEEAQEMSEFNLATIPSAELSNEPPLDS